MRAVYGQECPSVSQSYITHASVTHVWQTGAPAPGAMGWLPFAAEEWEQRQQRVISRGVTVNVNS
jgi:hypothetical protein